MTWTGAGNGARVCLIAACLTTVAGCIATAAGCGGSDRESDTASLASQITEEQKPDHYDRLFPYYAEICATSPGGTKSNGEGAAPDHAVLYLKGACKDETAAHPRLRRCRGIAIQPDHPEHGVGISVNPWLENVVWIATPGRSLFYSGNLGARDRLTQSRVDDALRSAFDAGVFQGIELLEYPTSAPQPSLADFAERVSLGTDFGLQFSRSLYCARLPLPEAMLQKILDFLNDLNDPQAEPAAGQRPGNSDLGVYTLHNALAAGGIWAPMSASDIWLRQLSIPVTPGAEFVQLARLGTEENLDDYARIYENRVQRAALGELDWLPTRHGAILEALPVHTPNDVYDTTFRLFEIPWPTGPGQTRDAVRLLSDPRFVDLQENLRHFAQVYSRILANRDEDGFLLEDLRGERFRRVRARYYAYIEDQADEASALLRRLDALESPRR